MQAAPIKKGLFLGISLQILSFLLMAAALSNVNFFKSFGFMVFVAGLLPIGMLKYPFSHQPLPQDWTAAIYVSFFYLFVGFVGGYVGERFVKQRRLKALASLVICLFLPIVSLVFMGIIFWVLRFES